VKKILIVDDEKPILYLLKKFLTREGFNAITTEHGKEVNNILENQNIDLVILDIIMPEVEGLEIIRAIKKTHDTIKIIAISGGGRIGPENYLKLASMIGAHYTMKKPLDLEKLLLIVKNLLK